MRSVLISIRPKWLWKIINGEKTIELRKSRPRVDTPFKCYIYCTKPNKSRQTICGCMVLNDDELYRHPKEGIKYGDSIELMCCDGYTENNFLNGKVIGEFICDAVDRMAHCGTSNNDISLRLVDERLYCKDIDRAYLGACQLSFEEIEKYANGRDVYGWHISSLKIYDNPRDLNELSSGSYRLTFSNSQDGFPLKWSDMKRPPQSWSYVEEVEE